MELLTQVRKGASENPGSTSIVEYLKISVQQYSDPEVRVDRPMRVKRCSVLLHGSQRLAWVKGERRGMTPRTR